jgi:parallel beta-helix repeat protein
VDCNLRDMADTMNYIYRTKEFCAFLATRDKNPLNLSKDDLKAFLAHLKKRDIKVSTINRLFSCISAFYEFLIIEELEGSTFNSIEDNMINDNLEFGILIHSYSSGNVLNNNHLRNNGLKLRGNSPDPSGFGDSCDITESNWWDGS